MIQFFRERKLTIRLFAPTAMVIHHEPDIVSDTDRDWAHQIVFCFFLFASQSLEFSVKQLSLNFGMGMEKESLLKMSTSIIQNGFIL